MRKPNPGVDTANSRLPPLEESAIPKKDKKKKKHKKKRKDRESDDGMGDAGEDNFAYL